MSKYTVDYFIKKFSKIPEEKWCTKSYSNSCGKEERFCAKGFTLDSKLKETAESRALDRIFSKTGVYPIYINDDEDTDFNQGVYSYLGDTPKERILTTLTNIKCAGL